MGRGQADRFEAEEIERVGLDAEIEELKDAYQWSEEFGIVILDADGWRGSFDLPELPLETRVSRKEFEQRMNISTIGPRAAFEKQERGMPSNEEVRSAAARGLVRGDE